MRALSRITALLAAALFGMTLTGCQMDGPEIVEPYFDGSADVSFSLVTDSLQTRSSLGSSLVDQVNGMHIYAFDTEGVLAAEAGSDGRSVTLSLNREMTYDVYILANMPEYVSVTSEDTFKAMVHEVSFSDMKSTGVPMCGMKTVSPDDIASGSVSIEVVRLAARVGFMLDCSSLVSSQITVKSVKLRQSATAVAPFCGPYVADESSVGDGDFCSEADVNGVNSGGMVWLYTLENCQGKLLPDNSDPWAKVPDEMSGNGGRCTYLEVTASYKGLYQDVPVSSENVVYRFFLGNDNTSDFSVERNKGVTVTLSVTDDGVYRDSWKVDYGDELPVISYEMEVTPSELSISKGEKGTLKALYHRLVDGVRDSYTDVSASASWKSSESSVASVSGGSVSALSSGYSTVTASYAGKEAYADVHVKDVVTYALEVTPNSHEMKVGESVQMKATYYTVTNGVRDAGVDVTSSGSCVWKSSASSVVNVTAGKVSAVGKGSATISATYAGISGSASVGVESVITYMLEMSSGAVSVKVGGTEALTVKYYTVTDGVKDSGVDVTASAAWTIGNSGVATVNMGVVKGLSDGTTTVKAEYNGSSASAQVTVSDVVTYQLRLSHSSMSIAYGSTGSVSALYDTLVNGEVTSTEDVSASASWTSQASGIVSVESVGSSGAVLRAKGSGSASVSAEYQGMKASVAVSVTDVTTYSLEITPSSAVVNAGSTVSLSVMYNTFTNGVKVKSVDVTSSASWSSSDMSVATVVSGVVSGVKGGTADICASYGGLVATAAVTVKDVTTYALSVSPSEMSVQYGKTGSIVLTLHTKVNGTVTASTDITASAEWTSDNPSAVSIQSAGVVKAAGSGSAVVKASYQGMTASVAVTVTDVVTHTLALSVSGVSVPWNSSTQIKATYYTVTNGVRNSGTDVTSLASWSSDDTSVAVVSGGLVTGKKGGSQTTVKAVYDGLSASATVIVTNVVTYSLDVTPDDASVNVNASVQLTATYYTITNGVSDAGTDVSASASWSSSAAGIAQVGSTGSVKGISAGTAEISATYGGVTASSDVTVNDVITYSVYGVKIATDGKVAVGGKETMGLVVMKRKYVNGVQSGVEEEQVNSTQGLWSITAGTSYASIAPASGVVIGKALGTVTVKVTYRANSSLTATADITIYSDDVGTDTGWEEGGNIEL